MQAKTIKKYEKIKSWIAKGHSTKVALTRYKVSSSMWHYMQQAMNKSTMVTLKKVPKLMRLEVPQAAPSEIKMVLLQGSAESIEAITRNLSGVFGGN